MFQVVSKIDFELNLIQLSYIEYYDFIHISVLEACFILEVA